VGDSSLEPIKQGRTLHWDGSRVLLLDVGVAGILDLPSDARGLGLWLASGDAFTTARGVSFWHFNNYRTLILIHS